MKVRIYQPHTHAGIAYVPGPTGIALDVSAADAAFLKQHGVLDPPKPVAAPAATAPDQAEQPDT